MASQDDNPKRRPVDALFGDSDAPSATGYIVEDPQPVTTVSPPPPDQTAPALLAPPPPRPAPPPAASPIHSPDPTSAPPAIPAAAPKPLPFPVLHPPVASATAAAAAPKPLPLPVLPPPVAPAAAAAGHPAAAPLTSTPIAPPATAKPAPTPFPASKVGPSRVLSHSRSAEPPSEPEPIFTRPTVVPSDRISQMYEEVRNQVGSSRTVTNECLALLLKAREAYSKQDLAGVEFYTESVRARMKQSALSQAAARHPVVWAIGLWNLGMLGVSLLSLPLTYILNLTFFGFAVAPEAILLLRAAAWGCIGAVLGSFAGMAWAVHRREYDPASNWGYLARPIIGVIFGGVFFVLSQAGVVAGNMIVDGTIIGPIFLYVFALLAGFGQDIIFESLRNLLRTFFRVPKK